MFSFAGIISFTSQKDYLSSSFIVIPKSLTLASYERLFDDQRLWSGYRSTLFILALGMPLNVFLTFCLAYALSRKGYPGRRLIFVMVLFTMIFQGGIVPMYLVMRSLSLTNKLWSVILAYGVNTFYMIIVKNYIDILPESLVESAKLDGAGEWTILGRIVLPLSKPILATIVLFYSVDRWNEWYNAMVFLRNNQLYPLQLVLRNIVINSEVAGNITAASAGIIGSQFVMGIKMAAVIMTMLPIMCVYPFLQRHFVKGIMIGAIKA
jgi:putative aldouronate transport system permease protein